MRIYPDKRNSRRVLAVYAYKRCIDILTLNVQEPFTEQVVADLAMNVIWLPNAQRQQLD